MTDSFHVSRVTPVPFDQDTSSTFPEVVRAATCPECHLGHCENCSRSGCRCTHVYPVFGRAIVELNDTIQRSAHLLRQVAPPDHAPG